MQDGARSELARARVKIQIAARLVHFSRGYLRCALVEFCEQIVGIPSLKRGSANESKTVTQRWLKRTRNLQRDSAKHGKSISDVRQFIVEARCACRIKNSRAAGVHCKSEEVTRGLKSKKNVVQPIQLSNWSSRRPISEASELPSGAQRQFALDSAAATKG